jgi:hypothetical protein
MLQASSACESLRLLFCDPQPLQKISEQALEKWKPYTPREEPLTRDGLSSGPAFRRAPPIHLVPQKANQCAETTDSWATLEQCLQDHVIDNLPNLQCEILVCNPLYSSPP